MDGYSGTVLCDNFIVRWFLSFNGRHNRANPYVLSALCPCCDEEFIRLACSQRTVNVLPDTVRQFYARHVAQMHCQD